MSRRINIKHLQALRAVANYRHFTRAAASLGLSQPALSTLIKQLEDDLGIALLNRSTRSVELTPIGRTFLVEGNQTLSSFERAIARVSDLAALRAGRLRIAALPSICCRVLPPVIGAFRETYPSIALSLSDAHGDGVLEMVESGLVDVAIGYLPVGDDFHHTPILEDALQVVMHASHPLAEAKALKWADISEHDVIAMSHGTTVRRLTDERAGIAGVVLRNVLEANQMQTAITFASAKLGAAILPGFGIPETLPSDVVCRPIDDPEARRTISVFRASRVQESPASAAFTKMLLDHSKSL
ncbi:LysR family transcriptional regulator [Novosphingobium malaysiense]|nr:LysR family transcriptional regulator [Novosphingobium malaysiense]